MLSDILIKRKDEDFMKKLHIHDLMTEEEINNLTVEDLREDLNELKRRCDKIMKRAERIELLKLIGRSYAFVANDMLYVVPGVPLVRLWNKFQSKKLKEDGAHYSVHNFDYQFDSSRKALFLWVTGLVTIQEVNSFGMYLTLRFPTVIIDDEMELGNEEAPNEKMTLKEIYKFILKERRKNESYI
jgi:hypothetical protein